jgi:hypothetical protein
MIPLICTSPGRRVDVVLPGTLDVVINDLSGSSGMIKSEIAPVKSEQSQSQSQNPNSKHRFLDPLLCIEGVTVATMHPESIACTILINSKNAMARQRNSSDISESSGRLR